MITNKKNTPPGLMHHFVVANEMCGGGKIHHVSFHGVYADDGLLDRVLGGSIDWNKSST